MRSGAGTKEVAGQNPAYKFTHNTRKKMKDAIKEIEKFQEEIMEVPEDFGTPSEVEAAIQTLEILKVRLESM